MFDRLGLPSDVVELRKTPIPEPGPGEAIVRMTLSPIIPGDSLFTQGLYPEPVRPLLPGETAGNYGVGFVERIGEGVTIAPGSFVSVTHRRLWAEYACVPQRKLIKLDEGYRPDLGAEFMNLVTAWDLLEASGVEKGGWLAVSGGHSTVAILITQFAAALGIKVLSIVRKKRPLVDLEAMGAAHVLALDETPDLREAALAVSGGGIDGLVDCVGGTCFTQLVRSLRLGSKAIIYGGFDPQPFMLHNLDVLLSVLEIRSYIYRYFFDPPAPADEMRVRQLLAFAASLDLRIPCAGRFRLNQYKEALSETLADGAVGRRYFAIG